MKTTKRNNVLLVHGIFLLFVTGANAIASLYGVMTGKGIFFFLQWMPLAEVGFLQAYLLMMLLGVVLIYNARSEQSWKYDVLAAVAHTIPLTALFLFSDVVHDVMGTRIFIASALIHFPWILIETVTAFIKYRADYVTAK